MTPSIIRFYASLIFLYFSDMSILMAVMWLSYEVTQSALFLSMMLSISAILPLCLKKLKWRIDLLALSLSSLMQLRMIIYGLLMAIAYFIGNNGLGLTLFSILTGILSVTILSSYEARNTQLVLENKIEKAFSARVMQTVIQVGAFSGAMIGSVMLKEWGFQTTIFIVSILDISVCFLLFLFEPKTQLPASSSNAISTIKPDHRHIIYLISLLLGLVALHISTFNLTVPILFQEIRQWQITDFGLASGMAGLGAFLAVFFKHPPRCYAYLLVLWVIIDGAFMFHSAHQMIMPYCLLIGFCVNSIRIALREKLIGLAKDHAQAVAISGISASFYVLFQSFGSVVFGIMLELLPFHYLIQSLLPLVALFILILFSLFYFKPVSYD